jgi:hypothetical protein
MGQMPALPVRRKRIKSKIQHLFRFDSIGTEAAAVASLRITRRQNGSQATRVALARIRNLS